MNKKLILIIVAGFIFISCSHYSKYNKLRNGDIIFQISRSSQSKAIQLATNSKYNHMGIIYVIKDKYYVYEATQPVRLISLEQWMVHGVNSHYVIKRLKNYKKLLIPKKIQKMKEIGEKFKGKDYDLYFEWSDDRIYCSELVWKIYYRALNIKVGELKRLKDFNLNNPNVKKKLKERYEKSIPFNEIVISPGDMYNSKLLYTVYRQ